MRFEFGGGLMEIHQRRAGEFKLAGRFERNRFAAALQADWLAMILNRLPSAGGDAFQHGADAERLVGRRGEIAVAEAEFLVLGADAKFAGGFAADCQIFRHLLHRCDRREIGFAGI